MIDLLGLCARKGTEMFEPEKLPAPDEMGFFYHPDLPDTGEDESIVPPLEAMGFEAAFIAMDYDAPEEVTDAWYEQDDMAAPSRWTPTPPTGDGWLLAAKYDTESGPHAIFVRPNTK